MSAVARVGTVLKMPVFVHYSTPIVIVVIFAFHSYAFFEALGWVIGSLVLVAVHELGHAALVRLCGQRVEYLTIYGWGGECAFTRQGLSDVRHSVIAWGGVLAQGIVLGIAWVITARGWVPAQEIVVGIFQFLLIGNLLMIGFNLIPWPGLDGHRAWPLPYHLWVGRRRRPTKRAVRSEPLKRVSRTVDRKGFRVIDGGKDE
jgi:Zn-dependent protease